MIKIAFQPKIYSYQIENLIRARTFAVLSLSSAIFQTIGISAGVQTAFTSYTVETVAYTHATHAIVHPGHVLSLSVHNQQNKLYSTLPI